MSAAAAGSAAPARTAALSRSFFIEISPLGGSEIDQQLDVNLVAWRQCRSCDVAIVTGRNRRSARVLFCRFVPLLGPPQGGIQALFTLCFVGSACAKVQRSPKSDGMRASGSSVPIRGTAHRPRL